MILELVPLEGAIASIKKPAQDQCSSKISTVVRRSLNTSADGPASSIIVKQSLNPLEDIVSACSKALHIHRLSNHLKIRNEELE